MNPINREKLDFDLDIAALLDVPESNPAFAFEEKSEKPEGKKYVVFHLDEKLYAVHSESVTEVIGFLPVTPLPFVPDWLAGAANLRGEIIPVANLRLLWKKPPAERDAKSKFLVLRSEKSCQTAAFMVDKLSEMITLAPSDIEFSAADFASSFPTFVGRATRPDNEQTIFLLDSEYLFSSLEINAV